VIPLGPRLFFDSSTSTSTPSSAFIVCSGGTSTSVIGRRTPRFGRPCVRSSSTNVTFAMRRNTPRWRSAGPVSTSTMFACSRPRRPGTGDNVATTRSP
jgi:hypothetical protein